jgi:hypothetical protein
VFYDEAEAIQAFQFRVQTRGKFQATALALQQLRAQRRFKFADQLLHSSRGHTQFFCRQLIAQVPGDSFKRPQ